MGFGENPYEGVGYIQMRVNVLNKDTLNFGVLPANKIEEITHEIAKMWYSMTNSYAGRSDKDEIANAASEAVFRLYNVKHRKAVVDCYKEVLEEKVETLKEHNSFIHKIKCD